MLKWNTCMALVWMFCTVLLHSEESLINFCHFQPLDAQTQILLNQYQKYQIHCPVKDVPLDKLRVQLDSVKCKLNEIKSIKNITFSVSHGEIPIRIYIPKGDASTFPVFLYFHGGGWTLGSLDHYDFLCQQLAVKAQCLVVSVDYHLAPEHPFPIPLKDCYEGLKWVSNNIIRYKGDPKRIAVGGDSAGGNLAAAVTLLARDLNNVHLIYQVLIYPALSYQFDTFSYEFFKEGYFLTQEDMKCFWNYYAQNSNKNNPYLSPLKAKNLRNLPPALLIVADYDVLRDDSLCYAERLAKEGIPFTLKKYGSIHGFVGNEQLDISKQAIEDIADSLRKTFTERTKD